MHTTVPNAAAQPLQVQRASRRGEAIQFRKEGEFHQCWYPIALSSEVTVGSVTGAAFLDGRVVVYRTADGTAHVMSAYCRHLGADLSVGRVVGDRLECAFHKWRYDAQGSCVEIASGDRPPPQARVFSYPTAESLGIIWAFNGEQPLHPVPGFDVPQQSLVVRAYRNPLRMNVESSCVFLNSFDLQHFRAVHGMQVDVDLARIEQVDHTLRFDAKVVAPEFGQTVQARRLWGTSTVTIESEQNGRRLFLLHALCPMGADATQGFLANATLRGSAEDDARSQALLEQAQEYSLRLVNEDAPIFDTLRFRRDCLTASDRLLGFGIQYIRSYPCAHPGAEMIR